MAQTQTTKTAKSKRVVKAPAARKATPKAAAPKKVTNPHVEVLGSGKLEGHITGLISSNPRPKFPIIDTPKSVDDRKRKALYMLRDGYGGKRFSGAYLDAGIMKVLLAAGLVKTFGGERITMPNGQEAITIGDGLEFQITAEGMRYGKA